MDSTLPRVTPSIVIADDDDALREMLAESLRNSGYRVLECADGRELQDLLVAARRDGELPDLVISDQRMPRLTGLDVLSWLHRSLPELRFVLLSAFAAPQLQDSARRLGAARVFAKPVDLRELREFVVQLLGRPHIA